MTQVRSANKFVRLSVFQHEPKSRRTGAACPFQQRSRPRSGIEPSYSAGQRPNNRAAETDFNEAQQAGKPTE